MIILAIFLTVLAVVVSSLWFVRLVRVWNGAIEADDLMVWLFLLVTTLGITVAVLLFRWTILLTTGG